MFIPTWVTRHMSGLNGLKVNHDPSERLSWYLADAISTKRPNYALAQANMKRVCNQCHTMSVVERVYDQAEKVIASTNYHLVQHGIITAPRHVIRAAHELAVFGRTRVTGNLAISDLHRSFGGAVDKLINGAPPMAPLLFPNLSLLASYALCAYSRFVLEMGTDTAVRTRLQAQG